jgi:hypothetical protein
VFDMASSDKRASERAAHGEVLTAVSDGLVALLKEYYGKGPTQAKTITKTTSSSAYYAAASPPSSAPCSKAGAEQQ